MSNLVKAAQQALDAWDRPHGINYIDFRPYMDALRAALAEPVMPSPPQRKPLTDEEINELLRTMGLGKWSVNWLCRAIEQAHGITQ